MTKSQIHKNTLLNFFNTEIKDKHPKDLVKKKIIKVGYLDKDIFENSKGLYSRDIYISTKTLMHIYEKRMSVLEKALLPAAYTLLCYPERIYVNKDGNSRRGNILFSRLHKSYQIIAVMEKVNFKQKPIYQVVTIFLGNENYVRGLKCLWNGRTATPSSQYK